MKNHLGNRHGSTILVVVMVAAGLAVLATAIPAIQSNQRKTARAVRIHAAMAAAEAQLRMDAMNSLSYNDTNSGCNVLKGQASPTSGAPAPRCTLKPLLPSLQPSPLVGAKCPAGVASCGVVIKPYGASAPDYAVQFSSNPPTAANPPFIQYALSYQGSEIPTADWQVTLKLPPDLLTGSLACDYPNQLLQKVDADGTKHCLDIPGAIAINGDPSSPTAIPTTAADSPGKYIRSITGTTLAVAALGTVTGGSPASQVLNCGTGKMIQDIGWGSGVDALVAVNLVCRNRLTPSLPTNCAGHLVRLRLRHEHPAFLDHAGRSGGRCRLHEHGGTGHRRRELRHGKLHADRLWRRLQRALGGLRGQRQHQRQ